MMGGNDKTLQRYLYNLLLSVHLPGNALHVVNVRPLVWLGVDALRHQLPQAVAVLV